MTISNIHEPNVLTDNIGWSAACSFKERGV